MIYKILEIGGPKSLKIACECSFQSFSQIFCKYSTKGEGPGPLGPSPKTATDRYSARYGIN